MKTKSLASLPSILAESYFAIYTPGKSAKRSSGAVKLMPPTTPPDETTIRKLNDLASTPPFCTFRKARRHDML